MAVCAVLLMALAPSLSQALQVKAPAGWTEVCSVTGAKWVRLASTAQEQAPEPGQSTAHVLDHCPYCSLHVSDLGAPPASTAWAPMPLQREFPHRFLAAPHTLHAWLAAQPRGPPHTA